MQWVLHSHNPRWSPFVYACDDTGRVSKGQNLPPDNSMLASSLAYLLLDTSRSNCLARLNISDHSCNFLSPTAESKWSLPILELAENYTAISIADSYFLLLFPLFQVAASHLISFQLRAKLNSFFCVYMPAFESVLTPGVCLNWSLLFSWQGFS